MDHSRRKEVPLWLNPAVHVWTTKNDLPVVNLRDVSENLRLPKSAFRSDDPPQTSEEESFHAETTSNNSEKVSEPTKKEPLGALLAFMQRRSESQNVSRSIPNTASNFPQTTGTSVGMETEIRPPSFPELKPAKAMDVEFVQGVNLPGGNTIGSTYQSKLNKQSEEDNLQSVALFHDPVWGEVGSSFDLDSFSTKNDGKNDIFSTFKLENFMDNLNKNDIATTDLGTNNNNNTTTSTTAATTTTTTTTTATITTASPPPFPTSNTMNEVVFQSPSPPAVVTSPAPQIAYPQGFSLGPAGWTAPSPHGPGVPLQSLQFVSLPMSFMPQNAMMAMQHAYRMPYQFYQMHPQISHLASLQQQQPGGYQPSGIVDLNQMSTQRILAPQNPSPRPGTNVGAAPFVPGGKGV